MLAVPGIQIPGARARLKGFKKAPSKAPVLHAIKVRKAATGFTAKHDYGGLIPPKTYIFPNSDKLAKHVTHTARSLWLGNKTSTPRVRGATAARREKQVETTSY